MTEIAVTTEPVTALVQFGGKTITYTLERVARKTTAITVKPDQGVWVRAPQDADSVSIEGLVRKRAAWIIRQQQFFGQFLPRTPARAFVGGETHLYMGRKYRLRVRLAERAEVKLRGGYIYVSTPQPADALQVRRLLYEWYAARAHERFPDRLALCMQSPVAKNIVTPHLKIRPMAKRWGSCQASGLLTLNLDLIRAPSLCIDYVIVHELCHLHHPNHSPQFYRLLISILPDWKATKLRLEQALS